MNAEFYASAPQSAHSDTRATGMMNRQRSRRIHRWVAGIFTLTVAANFAMLPWGQPPAIVTYAPLPPLLVLMVSGLTMLISSWIAARRTAKQGGTR